MTDTTVKTEKTDKPEKPDKNALMNRAALDILGLARGMLIVKLRFLDLAMNRLELQASEGATLATDGVRIIYGPEHVVNCFREERERPVRDYLHMVLHCIFSHMFVGTLVDQDLWDIACDIAVESTINELALGVTGASRESAQIAETELLRSETGTLTAEKIYHHLLESGLTESETERLGSLFAADDHSGWHRPRPVKDSGKDDGRKENNDADEEPEENDPLLMPPLEEEWKEVAERIEDALETFFRDRGDSAGEMMQNLRSVTREKYDYSAFLRKFAVAGEAMMVNDEEFDYIFYTYGLELYGNMPLVEPLEYKEVKRIKDFVIAIDTSGSTSGELVQKFLQKTYNILKSSESYFSHFNIHIIQCDAAIQEHVKITSEDEFDEYIRDMTILGLGGTDFRPVFTFVDGLVEKGEFSDLKGLIYFTDGKGIFPRSRPKYETAFVFLEDGYDEPDVPPWAIRVVLQSEDI